MRDAVAVQKRHGVCHRFQNFLCCTNRKRALLFHIIRKTSAIKKLHHIACRTVSLKHLVDRHYVAALPAQTVQPPRLRDEILQAIGSLPLCVSRADLSRSIAQTSVHEKFLHGKLHAHRYLPHLLHRWNLVGDSEAALAEHRLHSIFTFTAPQHRAYRQHVIPLFHFIHYLKTATNLQKSEHTKKHAPPPIIKNMLKNIFWENNVDF